MQKRRYHRKSRKGCQGCKERRIKCDEMGPPCSSCAIRNQTCVYNYPRPPPDEAGGGGWSGASTTGSSSAGGSARHHDDADRRLLELELMHRYCTVTYKSLSSMPHDLHMLQVLMPRLGVAKYQFLLQGLLAITALDMARIMRKAREAAEAERLRSTTSPESQISAEHSEHLSTGKPWDMRESPRTELEYVRAAREYYSKGSAAFRVELARGAVTSDNTAALFMFAFGAAIINIAMPPPPPSPSRSKQARLQKQAEGKRFGSGDSGEEEVQQEGVEDEEEDEEDEYSPLNRVYVLFNLLNGLGIVTINGWDLLIASDVWPQDYVQMPSRQESAGLLDDDTKAAFERLWTLRQAFILCDESDAYMVQALIEDDLEVMGNSGWEKAVSEKLKAARDQPNPVARTRWWHYRIALLMLERFYAEDIRGTTKGMSIGWPPTGGPPMAEDVKERRPYALLLLMHWGVLLHRLHDAYWWIEGVGEGMMRDISDILVEKRSEWAGETEGIWMESIDWVRGKVGLDPLWPAGSSTTVSEGGQMDGDFVMDDGDGSWGL